jgi:outer membrane protein assembly factor BamB
MSSRRADLESRGRSIARALVLSLLTLACVQPAIARAADSDDPVAAMYERTLRQRSIVPDSSGLIQFLRDLHPNEETQNLAARLIAQLNSDSYAERESAMTRLILLPSLPVEALKVAAETGEPEVRWRAKVILDTASDESANVLYAVFKTIELKKLRGTVPELIRVIPLCDKPHLVDAARAAIEAVAEAQDAPPLREALSHAHPDVRATAAGVLWKCDGQRAIPHLRGVLEVPGQPDKVKLAAVVGMANLGERESLALLHGLLMSDDAHVRVGSFLALTALTGQHFNYAAYDTEEKRLASAATWKEWIDGEGKSAELKFPIDLFAADAGYLHGNTLLAFGYQNKVVEYDPSGKEVWSYPGGGAWSAEKLMNGNVLIAAYNENRVIEVDAAGTIVWERPSPSCLNARPLRNGNILISEHSSRKVYEVDRDKNIVWEYETPASCCDAHRLDNGNTMIAEGNRVIEVDREKKIVWEFASDNLQPYGIQPLRNGNVLIASLSGKATEVTRDKTVIWEVEEQNPVDVFRLPNGNTLVTGAARFVEYTPDKTVVWSKDGCNYGSARR